MVNNVINHTYVMNPLPFPVKCQRSGSFRVGEHIHNWREHAWTETVCTPGS